MKTSRSIAFSLFTVLFSTMITALFSSSADAAMTTRDENISAQLAQLEASVPGRLGVYLIDPIHNDSYSYKGDERFPFCSTGKVLVVAKLLHDSQTNPLTMNIAMTIKQNDLTNYNPITGQNVGKHMTVSTLSQAALQYSDNTAMNLLLRQAGGIGAINAFARTLGDRLFLLTRNEPSLNTSLPGDERDTSTPYAMAHTLQKLTLGNGLEKDKRDLLTQWMKGNTTGNASIKAGVPTNWTVADKTGSGDYGTTNDVAVMWTEKHNPIILVVYFTQFQQDVLPRKDVLAKAANIVTSYIH